MNDPTDRRYLSLTETVVQTFGRIYGDSAGILQLLVDDRDAGDAVVGAEEDPMHDVVDEIPIRSHPIVGHLFHVVETLRKRYRPSNGGIFHGRALKGS